jgi:hypothetical protein
MRTFLSVFLVSGEINFNFGRSAFFLSKSEVKIYNILVDITSAPKGAIVVVRNICTVCTFS